MDKNLFKGLPILQSIGVLTGSESRVQSAPVSAEAQPGFARDLEAAVLRAQENLFRLQKPEGYWNGELLVDSTLVSDTLIYHHWNGKVDKAWQRKAVHHIFSMQLPDGGWNIYQNGPSEVNATIKAYLALKLAGVPETDPRMLKAREVALHFGGVPRMNTFSKLYLALIGLFPWEYVPTIPCRSAAHRQMVSRQFLGHEQLVARHARAAGHHQPFQADPPGGRGFGRALSRRHPRTRPRARTRPGKDFAGAIFSCGWTACTSWPSGSPSIKSIRSAGPRSKRPSNGCWSGLKAPTGWRRFFPRCSIRSSR